MSPRLITVTGPSGSGKSTLVQSIIDLTSTDFQPVLVPKFTTRPQRESDGPEAVCVETIPASCDLVYEQYGVRYGLNQSDLWDLVASGRTPVVILNDIRAVEDIREQFGRISRSLYMFREAPSMDQFAALAESRGAGSDEYQTRFRKAQAIHRIYIENLHLFDWVVLNVGSRARLKEQVRRLIRQDVTARKFALNSPRKGGA